MYSFPALTSDLVNRALDSDLKSTLYLLMESSLKALNQSPPSKFLKATTLTSHSLYLIIVVITHLVMRIF